MMFELFKKTMKTLSTNVPWFKGGKFKKCGVAEKR